MVKEAIEARFLRAACVSVLVCAQSCAHSSTVHFGGKTVAKNKQALSTQYASVNLC